VAVVVKLDAEAGAAGLAFHADGKEAHYGFYPSGGKLRLVPLRRPRRLLVKILKDEPSKHYRPATGTA